MDVRGSMVGALKPVIDQIKELEPPSRQEFWVSGVLRDVGVVIALVSADTPCRCGLQQRASHTATVGCGVCGVKFRTIPRPVVVSNVENEEHNNNSRTDDDNDSDARSGESVKPKKKKRIIYDMENFISFRDWETRCEGYSG